jgi:hypothetical protein
VRRGHLARVSLLRLAAQRLAGERHPTVAATVRTMTALQGQDLPGVLCSAALRTDGGSLTGVRAAMDAGEWCGPGRCAAPCTSSPPRTWAG